ncbi:MAG: AraC family transcriptional regulator [Pseudomonadota bacterium]
MNWPKRFNAALNFIEQNLQSQISTDDVARVACCSRYHFHRVFVATFKISCAHYIRMRRLTLAAAEVIGTTQRISDIGGKYGFDSPNAFSRAFRRVHGVNPSAARAGTVHLRAFGRKTFPAGKDLGDTMDYSIVDVPSFNILGKSKTFSFDEFVKDGPEYWKTYVKSDDYTKLIDDNASQPGAKTHAPMLTAYFPQEEKGSDAFIDVLGIETAMSSHDSYEIYRVPSANYAEFHCTYKTSMKTNRYIYSSWFADTGYERDSKKPDIASYFPVPFRPLGEMRIRWWIPIRS